MATQNWIKTYVIQILPVLALIVYIIGFAYYMVYYYQFGINITSYITLAEVLVSTLTPILIVVMLSVAFFGLQFLSRVPQKRFLYEFKKLRNIKIQNACINKVLSIIHRCKRKKRVINKYYDQKDAKESFHRELLSIPIVFVISSIIIPFNIYIGAIETKYKYFWIVVLLMLCFPYAGLYLRSYRKVRFRIVKVYHNLVAAIILFISILTCMVLLGVYNANLDKKSNEQRFHITMQNSVEYTDQDYNYIGECGSAIFLYNRENESTVVLNMANLMSIVYYNKRDNIYTRTVEEFMKMSQEKGH